MTQQGNPKMLQMTSKQKTTLLWKKLANEKKISNYDVVAYALIKAINAKSNEKLEVARALLLKSFTPITNDNKTMNGAQPFQALTSALHRAYWSTLFEELSTDEKKLFRSMVEQLIQENWVDTTYAYILVRTDIPPVHQAVQAAHATMLMGQQVPASKHDARYQSFCLLDGGDETALREFGAKIQRMGIKAAYFWEPDANKLWDGLHRKELTAIALHPLRKSVAQRKGFLSEKKLLTM
jgi:hypothetical protein